MHLQIELAQFFNHEGTKVSSRKKIHDNTTKDNVTVTSSSISQNDGIIRILKILKSWPIFLTMKMRYNLNKFCREVR